MSSLFPSCSYKSTFDPTMAESSGTKKKRKLLRLKPFSIKVMAVKASAWAIPKGMHKKKVLEEGREKIIQITKLMTSREIQSSILSAYQHLEISEYEILESGRNGKLSPAKEQWPNGTSLMEGIYKRKAVLYIREKLPEVVCYRAVVFDIIIVLILYTCKFSRDVIF